MNLFLNLAICCKKKWIFRLLYRFQYTQETIELIQNQYYFHTNKKFRTILIIGNQLAIEFRFGLNFEFWGQFFL